MILCGICKRSTRIKYGNYLGKKIGFTYRSEFERKIDELLEELQALIFSKIWNNGKEGITAYMLGAIRHQRYHYKQKGLLYDLYVRKMFLPLYGGLHDNVVNLNLEQEQEQELKSSVQIIIHRQTSEVRVH